MALNLLLRIYLFSLASFIAAIPQQIFIPGLSIDNQPQPQVQPQQLPVQVQQPQQQQINSFDIPSTNVYQKLVNSNNNGYQFFTQSVNKVANNVPQYATNKYIPLPTNFINSNFLNYNVQTTKPFVQASVPATLPPLVQPQNQDIIITEISSPSAAIAASLTKLKQQQQQQPQYQQPQQQYQHPVQPYQPPVQPYQPPPQQQQQQYQAPSQQQYQPQPQKQYQTQSPPQPQPPKINYFSQNTSHYDSQKPNVQKPSIYLP